MGASVLAGALLAVALTAPAHAAAPDTIRVGGPSAPDEAKVAIVGSAADLAGSPFTVVDATTGVTVLTGVLEPAPGAAAPFAHAARADLSAVTAPGAYQVQTAGLTSTPWVVRVDGSGDLVPTLLRFFDANADGREPSALHRPAHLHDAVLASGPQRGSRVQLAGGWMDAGDMLHFTSTTAYAAVLLQYAARLDVAHAAALERQADVGVRWLVRAHPSPGVFVGQVGDARDHDLGFRRPEADDGSTQPGVGRRLAYPTRAADSLAKASAALALATARATGGRRTRLLAQARAWYAAADARRSLRPVLPGGFYAGSAFADDLALAGATLYRLTGRATYLAWPRRFLVSWVPSTTGWTLSWDDTGALAAADLCGALGAPPVDDRGARELACRRLADAARGAVGHADGTAFALPGALTWGTTATVASGGAITAAAARVGLVAGGAAIAAGARDFLLGRNPWGAGFVVGYGANAARQPHHWAVSIRPNEPVGAVVGGPAPREQVAGQVAEGAFEGIPAGPFDHSNMWVYEDRTANYVTSEPALDYVANAVLLQAVLTRTAGGPGRGQLAQHVDGLVHSSAVVKRVRLPRGSAVAGPADLAGRSYG
jgi:endoglucanase